MFVIRKFELIAKIKVNHSLKVNFNQLYTTCGKSTSSGEPSSSNLASTESISSDMKHFMETFPSVIKDLADDSSYNDIPEAVSCFKNVLLQTVPTGRKSRALTLIRIYKNMEEAKNLTPENIKLVNILGWCIEMLQTMSLLIDDMLDDSYIRRGKISWHKNEYVGSRAILDIMLLENYTYRVLKKHFSRLPVYIPAMELMQETSIKMGMGETLDMDPLDTNKFTRKRFEILTRYKTTSFTFELPYKLARCLCNKNQEDICPQIHDTLLKLGLFFQIQNDFLDCYGDMMPGFKSGNDIEEGKCSWLIVTALEKATPEEQCQLKLHYGRKGIESIAIVKELYNVLKIREEYSKYEKKMFDFIERSIDQVSKIACPEIMFRRLGALYE